MTDRAIVERRIGNYDDTELQAIIGNLAGVELDQVCEVAAVVVFHPAPGRHEMRALTDNGESTEHVAALLTHAARHIHGGCESCARRNREAGNGD